MNTSCKAAAAAALAFFATGIVVSSSAQAQIATDLKCNGCVNTKQLGKKAVRTAKINDAAVTTKKLKDSAVNSAKIADGAVAPADLADDAQPAGIASASGDQDVAVSGTETIYRTVTLDAPADGNAMVAASWVIYGLNVTTRCSVTTGTTVEAEHTVEQDEPGTALVNFSGAAVRAFPVTAGENTFNLVCFAVLGTPNIRDSSLVALFVPASY